MATLGALPAELILIIAGHIKARGYGIARLALISRGWQTNIESIIFSKLSIHASDLERLSQSLSRTRFLAVRELDYRIDDVLPGEPNDIMSVRISANACATYSDAFTQSIRDLFTMLNGNCDNFHVKDSHPGLALNLISTSFLGKGSMYLEQESQNTSQDAAFDSGEESDAVQYSEDDNTAGSDDWEYDEYGPESKLTRARLELTGEALPIVPIVTRFTNDQQLDRRKMRLFQMVWPPSWSVVASCFPNAKAVSMYACDNERRDRQGRRAARDEFARSLQILPPNIANIGLMYSAPGPYNRFRRTPRLTDDTLGYDIFSHELGLSSQHLVSLVLQEATISFVDFFACSSSNDWPLLEKLDMSQIQPASTDGTWYFTMNPDLPRVDYIRNANRSLRSIRNCTADSNETPAVTDRPFEWFRTTIISEKLEEIYLSAAKAVRRMRKLKTLVISFELEGDYGGPGMHEFAYEAGHPEDSVVLNESSLADIKVEWMIVPSVKINNEVLAAWRDVAFDRGLTIELYIVDNPEDLYDYNLIE